MALDDLKPLIEEGNKTIAALRGEVESIKSADVLAKEKVSRIEADLAKTLSEKAAVELKLKAFEDRIAEVETKGNRPGTLEAEQRDTEHKTAFLNYMRKGDQAGAMHQLFELQQKATDVRVATGASGGFALPKQIATDITKMILDISPIRSIAKVVQVGSPDYHELVDGNGFGGEWLGETDTHNQTSTPNISDVAPTFGEISAKPEATRQSISDLFFDVEGWLMDRGAEMFAISEGLAFVSGNGTNKPTGFLAGPTPVVTADAARAVGTLQYLATGQAAALATNPFDSFKDMVMSTRAGYRVGATWVMNSITMAALAKVKDTQGRYLLQTDVAAGTPYQMEGFGITVAEDMPVIGAGAFPVAFGNFKRGYLIADIAGVWMIRDEVTKPGYVRFPMSKRVGGKLLDTNAIKLLKVAVS